MESLDQNVLSCNLLLCSCGGLKMLSLIKVGMDSNGYVKCFCCVDTNVSRIRETYPRETKTVCPKDVLFLFLFFICLFFCVPP